MRSGERPEGLLEGCVLIAKFAMYHFIGIMMVYITDGHADVEQGENDSEHLVEHPGRMKADTYCYYANGEGRKEAASGPAYFQPFHVAERLPYLMDINISFAHEQSRVNSQLYEINKTIGCAYQ